MYSPTRLRCSLLLNQALQLNSDSSHAIAPKSPPDTILATDSCTLMLGEDKHMDLAAAYEHLAKKELICLACTMVH